MTARMSPTERRDTIVDAALHVMLQHGMAATVRQVADQMGSSSGLIHHYFASMDELLAAAFEQAATAGLTDTARAMGNLDDPAERLRMFFTTYIRAERDWAFQLWLDAWSEAARRPAVRDTSQRLNVAWQRLLEDAIAAGVGTGAFVCDDPSGAAWRILSLLDGLALQTVAHRVDVDRSAVLTWSIAHAETELGLAPGGLADVEGAI